jgi:hypothetical protein
MLKKLLSFLRTSRNVHLRQAPPNQISELVALLDRFLDDRLNYELEWDDFISWQHANPNIETIRLRIAESEALFFSDAIADRKRAVEMLIDERNRAAALVGGPPRTFEFPEQRRAIGAHRR